MKERYVPLDDTVIPCSYITGKTFRSENFLLYRAAPDEIDTLLQHGFRHFGPYFFRPVCRRCHRCIPLRIPAASFFQSRSIRRILSTHSHVTWKLHPPVPSREAFCIYQKHKLKFPGGFNESFEGYVQSFFVPSPNNVQLSMYIDGTLAGVSHLDMTETSVSAVYTYYNTDLKQVSLGSFAVTTILGRAKELGIEYVYLGYYIRECSHMNYKIRFRPNQALVEDGTWVDFTDKDGALVNARAMKYGFRAKKKVPPPV